jgi:hypothetical protein
MPATYIFQLTDHLYQKKLLDSEEKSAGQLTVNALMHDTSHCKSCQNVLRQRI